MSEKRKRKMKKKKLKHEKNKKRFDQLNVEDIKKIEPRLKDEVLDLINLKNSIKSKKSYGGTAFENIKKMIKKYKKEIK